MYQLLCMCMCRCYGCLSWVSVSRVCQLAMGERGIYRLPFTLCFFGYESPISREKKEQFKLSIEYSFGSVQNMKHHIATRQSLRL